MNRSIICDKCQGENDAGQLEDGLIQCQFCQEWFAPDGGITETLPDEPESKSEMIRRHAENLTVVAVIFFLVGLFLILFHLVFIIATGTDNYLVIAAGGALLIGAFWLYLIAQIIHIRANTGK